MEDPLMLMLLLSEIMLAEETEVAKVDMVEDKVDSVEDKEVTVTMLKDPPLLT